MADLNFNNDWQHSTASSPPATSGYKNIKVPCDDCLQRAQSGPAGSKIELCQRCMHVLHGGRRRKEAPNVRRARKPPPPSTASSIEPHAPSQPWTDDRREQHALQFFCRHSAPQLAGFFDQAFWQRMVLQAARHEPAVRHAIAAVGALHEQLLTGAVTNADLGKPLAFALSQCNKSIAHLIKPNRYRNTKLTLTTCVLFTCFEALQGHCEQAIRHAEHGYQLLRQFKPNDEIQGFAVELEQLALMMRRLETQSKGLLAKDMNVAPCTEKPQPPPAMFTSLHEARVGLEFVLNRLTVFLLDLDLGENYYDIHIANADKHLLFGAWLVAWETAFAAFLVARQANFTPQERKGAMVLKAHHIFAEILTHVDLSKGELAWDDHLGQFIAITDLAAAVLDDETLTDTSVIEARWKTNGVFISAQNAQLSFSLGIVDPLYEVAARCRCPITRRRALDLLARHPRQECIWSSWTAWKVGKYLMRLEEEGNPNPVKASDVEMQHRISAAWLDFSDKSTFSSRRGKVKYERACPAEKVQEGARFSLYVEDENGVVAQCQEDYVDEMPNGSSGSETLLDSGLQNSFSSYDGSDNSTTAIELDFGYSREVPSESWQPSEGWQLMDLT